MYYTMILKKWPIWCWHSVLIQNILLLLQKNLKISHRNDCFTLHITDTVFLTYSLFPILGCWIRCIISPLYAYRRRHAFTRHLLSTEFLRPTSHLHSECLRVPCGRGCDGCTFCRWHCGRSRSRWGRLPGHTSDTARRCRQCPARCLCSCTACSTSAKQSRHTATIRLRKTIYIYIYIYLLTGILSAQ